MPAELAGEAVAWWIWPIALFAVSFALGIVAVLAGVGGGVLFVPIVGGFFPFHLDFVRGAGLLLALSGALSAAPALMRGGFASLRLAMPFALVGSVTSVAGALLGLALPVEVVQLALGLTILAIVLLMWRAGRDAQPRSGPPEGLAAALGMQGTYHDPAEGRDVAWQARRVPAGLAGFAVIGVIAGMFGLGAGWANVPVLNLMMGAPLKISVATSKFLLSITDTSAAWIYMNKGCVIPMMVVPSLIGIMLGSFVGVRLLKVAKPTFIRWMVIAILAFAGLKALHKGLTVMGII
jgi:hypothetical protein